MGSRLDRTERLLNLVFCLMASTRPVPRSSIRAHVAGYDTDGSTEAFERMFERDKEELRGMGIPIDTVLDVDGDVAGYRIMPATYRLVDVPLTSEERAAVALAARVWEGAGLTEAASQAVLKLSADAEDHPPPLTRLPQFARMTADDGRLLPLLRATWQGRRLSFDYQGVYDTSAAPRTMDPWSVITRRGQWYVIGFDESRGAPRAFRLSRIQGDIRTLPESVRNARPEDFDPQGFITLEVSDPVEAEITLRAGAGADLIRRAVEVRDMGATMSVRVAIEREELLALLTVALPDITAVRPGSLLDDVRVRVEQVAAGHREGNRG